MSSYNQLLLLSLVWCHVTKWR